MELSWRDDARVRFTLAPLWGGGSLGLAGATLTLAAALRRRGRAKKTLARWEREDRRRARFMIVVPGLTPWNENGRGGPTVQGAPRHPPRARSLLAWQRCVGASQRRVDASVRHRGRCEKTS